MKKRILFILFGIALLAIIIFLGFKSAKDSSYVVWFGLASAILVTPALGSIGYAFKKEEGIEVLKRKIERERLIKEAATLEEKIKLLEKEKNHLNEIIKAESRRLMLLNKRESLDREVERISDEYKVIEKEIQKFGEKITESPARQELERIRKELKDRKEKEFSVYLNFLGLMIPLGEIIQSIIKKLKTKRV